MERSLARGKSCPSQVLISGNERAQHFVSTLGTREGGVSVYQELERHVSASSGQSQ
jgi:hypothetical protein